MLIGNCYYKSFTEGDNLRDMCASNWKEAANLYEFEHPGRCKPNYEYQIY